MISSRGIDDIGDGEDEEDDDLSALEIYLDGKVGLSILDSFKFFIP